MNIKHISGNLITFLRQFNIKSILGKCHTCGAALFHGKDTISKLQEDLKETINQRDKAVMLIAERQWEDYGSNQILCHWCDVKYGSLHENDCDGAIACGWKRKT